MTIHIRRVGEVADGSVTEAKLADNAVNLANGKVTGQLPTAKLADGAVVEDKLASLAVSTAKLKDQSITLAKAHQALKIHHFIGDETEVSVTGVVEGEVKTLQMPKSTSANTGIQGNRLHINAELKTSNASHQGSLKAYLDEEGSARITLNTSSETYEMVEGDADISDVTNGKHTVKIKLVSADAGETVYNDLIEIFIEK